VAQARDEWRASPGELNPERLIFIDETGAATDMTRCYGRCPRGQRLVSSVPWGHWKTTTFVAALRVGQIAAPPGAERIFGYASGAAIGQSLDIIIPERLRKRHWDGYCHVIKSGESRYGHGDILAVPGIKKDGAGVSIEFTMCHCGTKPAS
jgi:hypothetical protein